jgi:superfamily II DNA or RNA helicase
MIKLRPYQEKTINSLRQKMSIGLKRIIMSLTTGGGKTVIFCYMVSKALEKNKRCLILTHRTELLTQAGGTLDSFGLIPEIVNPKKQKLDFTKFLYVAMTKTVLSRINKEGYKQWLNDFDLIIIDEAHLQDFNNLFQYINKNTYVIGATATPERKGNQSSLDDFYQDIVNEITITDLIKLGYLAKPNSFGVSVDLSKIKTKSGDYDNEMLGNLYNEINLYNGVYDNYQRFTPNKKAIIFSPSIKASVKLVEELELKGLPIKHIDANSKDRKEIIKWFKNTPNALISNVGILTAGFDEATIQVVILYRATKSLPLFLQMVGRGSRTTSDKDSFTILDFGNNITRHGFWEEEREWSIKKKEKKKGLAPVKDCKCGALLRLSLMKCPYCGFDFPPPKEKETVEVILEKLKKNDVRLYSQFQKFIKLEQKANEKSYKKGWLVHQLKTNEDLKDYGKYKNYKPNWAIYQIEQRGKLNPS